MPSLFLFPSPLFSPFSSQQYFESLVPPFLPSFLISANDLAWFGPTEIAWVLQMHHPISSCRHPKRGDVTVIAYARGSQNVRFSILAHHEPLAGATWNPPHHSPCPISSCMCPIRGGGRAGKPTVLLLIGCLQKEVAQGIQSTHTIPAGPTQTQIISGD